MYTLLSGIASRTSLVCAASWDRVDLRVLLTAVAAPRDSQLQDATDNVHPFSLPAPKATLLAYN